VITIELLWADILTFLRHLLSPEVLGTVVTVGGVAYKFVKSLSKKFSEDSQEMVRDVKEQLEELKKNDEIHYKDLQKEILRIQLLQGMDTKRLSASEASYFYDKYRNVGGNSFVSEKYHEYLKELEDQDDEDSN